MRTASRHRAHGERASASAPTIRPVPGRSSAGTGRRLARARSLPSSIGSRRGAAAGIAPMSDARLPHLPCCPRSTCTAGVTDVPVDTGGTARRLPPRLRNGTVTLPLEALILRPHAGQEQRLNADAAIPASRRRRISRAAASACCRRTRRSRRRPKRCFAAATIRRGRRRGNAGRTRRRRLHAPNASRDARGEARQPVFGINRGTVGFLMNDWRIDRLAERIAEAKPIRVAPLEMRATTVAGETSPTRRSTKCRCSGRPGRPRRSRFRSTAASPCRSSPATASSSPRPRDRPPTISLRAGRSCPPGENARADADQPVPPAPLVGRDPARRHRRLLHILEAENRPVSAVADQTEVRDVARVEVRLDRDAR